VLQSKKVIHQIVIEPKENYRRVSISS